MDSANCGRVVTRYICRKCGNRVTVYITLSHRPVCSHKEGYAHRPCEMVPEGEKK
jgi:predicted nucleic acid-binding Zn ribbon protein